MFFKHIYEKGLAQASYLIGCQKTGEAIVIDPKRDIDEYLKIAEQEKLEIKYITETHIHADFLSGSLELQASTNAELLLSDEGGEDWQYQFPHTSLKDGSVFKVGNLKFEVLHTPGHTPEHISFLLTDTAASEIPIMIFTGDFVFVGDVGRPDLLENAAGIIGTKEIGAKQMFQSVKRFKELPDHVQVWPGHGAGSACGKALGAVPSSTVGYEKIVNWAMKINDENEFVDELLAGQPEPPKYFAMMKKLNKIGPSILGGMPHPARLTLNQFKKAINSNVKIIDTRDKLSFAGGHVCKSLNIQDNSAFSTWAGWLIDYEEDFILVAPDHRIEELTKALIRIGLDNVSGYVPDMDAWANACHETETVNQIVVADLVEKLNDGDTMILDVRGISEYNSGHIPGAINLHVGYLENNLDKIPHDKNVIVQCQSGDRSSIAASVLLSNGYKNITNLTGGIVAWTDFGQKIVSEQEVEMA
ncbi:MAG: MBL fold metallo-hydrolase [Melioribacteraceae bacterium]|nr:MBL fold metallo-hydrolase [Melioribacteraceae bacterium]MCF8265979.1 MBL fold metallo-hydrolase [Melioribacteraceae bacterium]